MIDYVKILFLNIDTNRLLELPFLEFKTEVSEKTGEISTRSVAKYNFCEITVFDTEKVLFKGSIHKLWNEKKGVKGPNYRNRAIYKGYNGNDFNLDNIIEVREHLENIFDCTPENMIFQNIELGVNLNTSFDPKLILKGLLLHRGTGFEYKFKRNYAQSKHSFFIIKIYNKGNQYGMSDKVIRIEIKVTRMEVIKSIGIKTFADVNKKTLDCAKNLLISRWGEVLLYDYTIRKKELINVEKNKLSDYSNPRYWLFDLTPNHRDRHKKRLKKIINNHSDNLHQKTHQLIEEKCVIINRLSRSNKCVINNTSYIVLDITQSAPKKRELKCPITGLQLTHEKPGAKYIKTTTLNCLHKYDVDKFTEICSLLLSNCTGNSPKYESDIILHLAKQVRNRYYNPNKNKQTGYNQKEYPNQLELFN